MENGLYKLAAHELLEKINKKHVTSQEIIDSLNERVKAVDSKVKAYVRIKDFDLRPTSAKRSEASPRGAYDLLCRVFPFPSKTIFAPKEIILNVARRF